MTILDREPKPKKPIYAWASLVFFIVSLFFISILIYPILDIPDTIQAGDTVPVYPTWIVIGSWFSIIMGAVFSGLSIVNKEKSKIKWIVGIFNILILLFVVSLVLFFNFKSL